MHDSFTHYRPKVYTAIILKGASLELKVNDQFNGMMLLKAKLWCLRFYRAMHFSAKRGIAIACRLSLSVCLSVCNVGEL